MTGSPGFQKIDPDDFARRYSMRANNLMWLLGAGASASAGVPTAEDMTWEFKQQLFISQRRVSPHVVGDLSSPLVRNQLQSHVDLSGNYPPYGSADEYASLFEVAYPSEADRRTYLDSKVTGAKPSYGHIALAALSQSKLTKLIWTTNFDSLFADACAKVYETTSQLTSIDLDAPDLASQCINEGRWPVEVKLHGDFRSRRLKNTGDELRHQDSRLRSVLIDSCRRFGLVVVGYSGRDDSIMDALEEAISQSGAFPAGLFWLHRGENAPLPRVSRLLHRAAELKIESGLVSIENFDESLRDLIRIVKGVDTTPLDTFATTRKVWTPAPFSIGKKTWPVIRLNALPLLQVPSVCRRVDCKIGGMSEVREAVRIANTDVLVARKRVGVLAFGRDTDVRTAFDPHGITDFDLHTIELSRLRYDSSERGLLREALTRALIRHRGLQAVRRRSADLLAPADVNESVWNGLSNVVGSLSGTVPNHPGLIWREGVSIRLDWASDQLWILMDPRIVFDGITNENKSAAADFSRERTIRRYNKQLNSVVDFWSNMLAGDNTEIRSFGIGDGVDAVFRLSSRTAYSRRVTA